MSACEQAGYKELSGRWPEFVMAQLLAGSFTLPLVTLHLISAFGRYPEAVKKVREEQARVEEKYGG